MNPATVNVAPGQVNAITTFQLRNDSNATLDFALKVLQPAEGEPVASSGVDAFNLGNVRIFRDDPTSGTPGIWDDADPLVTMLEEVGPDEITRLFVVADVPLELADGDAAGIWLEATAHEAGTSGLGDRVQQTSGANTIDVMDTVFADTAGVSDTNRDGRHSAANDYTVRTATLRVKKSSRVVWDPLNFTANPKMIPGSRVEYCISVANTGSVAATNVTITDEVPEQLAVMVPTIRINGTVTDDKCNADGVAASSSYVAPVVSGTIATVGANDTRTLVFLATIN